MYSIKVIKMSLQNYLLEKFTSWCPPAPEVVSRTTGDITLTWSLEQFVFLRDCLLYRLEKNNKLPKWIVVYSGGKTTKTIYNLAPRHPHKFRLKVILRSETIPHIADKAIHYYGDENKVIQAFGKNDDEVNDKDDACHDTTDNKVNHNDDSSTNESEDKSNNVVNVSDKMWIESAWSEETWTNTDTDGTSAVCFCMAVKCGYVKQIQSMLEERPALLGIHNTNNGFTPLATAVRKGDINIVKFLVSVGAEIEQPSAAGQTALHLALLARNTHIVELLLDNKADITTCDWNGLRAEHYAADSGSADMVRLVLRRGGDIHVKDHNGWTPLFRALCQGADKEMITELVCRGSDVDAVDLAGLPLPSVARLLKDRHGRVRDSVVRLVDTNYPHEKALANFTRITRKIHNIHQLLNLV